MRIDEIKLFEVRMRLKTRFQASTHAADELRHIIVRMRAGDLVGWGECAAPNEPYYLEETAVTSWHVLSDFLVPAVLGKELGSVEELVRTYAPVKGNTFARAGFEMAFWDLLGKEQGRSIASLLGGTRTEIVSGVSLGMEPLDALSRRIEEHLAQGYRRIKLKISPTHDVELFRALRPRFPDAAFMADANSAYTLADAEKLKELDQFGLTMIEQPLAWDDLVEHAKLQELLTTPICLDESIRSVAQARGALALRSCRVVNVKAGRVGGLLEAKRVHDVCFEKGIPVWCGGMHDYGIGRAANIALASLPGFTIPGDISGSDKYFDEDIVTPPLLAKNGALAVPTAPGLGVSVREDLVERWAHQVATFA